ncbi:MAG: hypothetical protein ACLQGP_22240 [Isosphaeraceae bacterium]
MIEPIANDGFRATSGPPFSISAEGTTRNEALSLLHKEIDRRIEEGAVVMPLDVVTSEENPWLAAAGMFWDNRLFDQWQAAIEEYRRKVDEEDAILP